MTDKIYTSTEAVERLARVIHAQCGCALGPNAEQPVAGTLRDLAAERDRLVAQLAEARAEGFRRGIEAAAQAAYDWFYDPENDAVTDTRLSATIRALPLPADLREVVDMISGK